MPCHHYLRLCYLIIMPFRLFFGLCFINSTMVSFLIHKEFFQHYLSLSSSLGHHHIPGHHMCHATSSTTPCHAITTLVFHWVCPAIISTGYSFVIREHLWHQWQLYTQICQQREEGNYNKCRGYLETHGQKTKNSCNRTRWKKVIYGLGNKIYCME